MHTHSTKPWRHDHTFAQDKVRTGEKRTLIVFALTLLTMGAEIAAGIAFGSMALLADGLHMGSHATALGINAFAYARKNADNPRFTFGTGKVNALGGYTGAILLAGFAVTMAWGSFERLLNPVSIVFNWAIAVAVIGLLVNALSVLLLNVDDHHHHHHGEDHHHHHEHHDLNLRSAYLHVLADALTSLLAIAALLAGKYLGAIWMDPMMGFVGAVLVLRWSWGLVKESSARLLDHQAPEEIRQAVQSTIETEEDITRRTHPIVWVIGATRSSKTALATAISDQGPASLGFHLIQTGDYFRQRYGKPDTYSRNFVFNISAFAAGCLEEQPDCHEQHLASVIAHVNKPCVIEGERTPHEFAKLYDPEKDMVFLLSRLDVEEYNTAIERGVSIIEEQMRWCVANGIAPQESVIKMTFGNGDVKAEYLGTGYRPDHEIIRGPVGAKKETGTPEERYPWINILIGLGREKVMEYYDIQESPALAANSSPQTKAAPEPSK